MSAYVTSYLIKFRDGTEMMIDGVSSAGLLDGPRCFYIEKNGFRSFFPSESVLYFGRKFDLSQ